MSRPNTGATLEIAAPMRTQIGNAVGSFRTYLEDVVDDRLAIGEARSRCLIRNVSNMQAAVISKVILIARTPT
jgi:hypothetical protein